MSNWTAKLNDNALSKLAVFHGWCDCEYRDKYGKTFSLSGKLMCKENYDSKWREVIEDEIKACFPDLYKRVTDCRCES